MVYNYRTGVIVPFVQKFKKQLILAVAAIFMASMAATSLTSNAVAPNWKVNAGSTIDFSCGGSNYLHTIGTVVDGVGGSFTGTGFYNSDPAYTWNATGNISGDVLELTITYTGTSTGSVYNLTNGTVDVDGSVSGDADSNCDSFTMPAGSLTPFSVTEIDVYGDTGAQNVKGAWMFGRDTTTTTAFNFVSGTGTLGDGSVHAGPISNTLNGRFDKFISEYFARESVENFDSLSYDFKIAGTSGDAADANQFYANFYVTLADNTNFRDCRFDYVPTTGSTSAFTTFTVNKNTVATSVGDPVDAFPCPNTLAGMPAGSYIRAISLNIGDTSTTLSDTDLEGYLDNVVFETSTETLVYDFEPIPTYTVTIDKYLNGVKATAVSANNAAFPMVATWAADNIGAGSGNYELDADGFNGNPTPYQAITSEMNMGADYTTNEVLGTNVAATCVGSGAPFRLVGYTTGDTPEEAQSGTPTTTVPAFTDLQENKFVVVWNETCVYATNKDECKNNGWMLGLADGRTFKNQGDCVSYFATKMKNQPAGSTTTTTNRR